MFGLTNIICIEDKKNTCYLILQQYPESIIHNTDLLKLIPRELDLISTPFSNTTTIIHEIESPLDGKKIVFNLMHGEDFIITYVNGI